jgi:hypothetical protein
VATTGRRRRRAPALTATLSAVALTGCAALAGCATKPPPASASGASGASEASGASRASRSPADPPPAWRSLCPVTLPAGLAAQLGQTVPESLRGELIPLGMNGQVAYVSAWTPAFSGVAALNLATGRLRRVQAFAHPGRDQADGSADGPWLAWEETVSLQSLDRFTVYAWNSATGRLLTLGHSLSGPGGVAWPSPWHPPAVSGDYAAWAQGYGPDGAVEVRLADLATGRVRIVRQGHTQPPFFDRDLLVWPESDRPGTLTTLRAVSLRTGRTAALPPVLRAVRGTDVVVTDGTRTAYLSPDLTSLYYSPAQDQRARVVLRLPAGDYFSGLALGPGTLAWTTTAATYLASTATGGYAKVTRRYGDATGSEPGVMISDPPGEKVAHPVLPLHVVSPAGVRWPSCPAG